ncbi:ribonuclease HII [Actinoplanes sp. TBRC 11911]|uniref:ribonuclease HII n=1 Tax=Actinoplanes sp. TBRC 11911 TaxID=2729386 RepID=UPI00145DC388|nr:ribonuclease HII [Actinoplanes sp. TBRC 11911]NMO52542.1 ribonuclease HII [Actinoplanes sp. TBRC 11911]
MLAPPRTVVRREGGLYALERALQRRGFRNVAGADEAGRGACAGPLVAAAAILPEGKRGEIDELADSKLLTPAARERVYEQVVARALAWSVMIIPATEVDARGLHVSNLAAMRRALASLSTSPEYVLTDGFPVDGLGVPGLAVWKGDRVAACVAAASVLAKVTRDRIMVELDEKFPGYGFAVHKGYVTDEHSAALASKGPCAEHRFSYVNVAAVSGRGNRPPRARRPAVIPAPALFGSEGVLFDASSAEPTMPHGVAEGTVGVASGDQPQPSPSVGEDEAMEGEKR